MMPCTASDRLNENSLKNWVEKSHTQKKKKTLTTFCQLQGCLLEGQEARPEEQHLGMAAGIFGSVKHTKVIRA